MYNQSNDSNEGETNERDKVRRDCKECQGYDTL